MPGSFSLSQTAALGREVTATLPGGLPNLLVNDGQTGEFVCPWRDCRRAGWVCHHRSCMVSNKKWPVGAPFC
jgi:hypothetical protein